MAFIFSISICGITNLAYHKTNCYCYYFCYFLSYILLLEEKIMNIRILVTSRKIYVRVGNIITIHSTEGRGVGSETITYSTISAAKKILGDISSTPGGSKK